MTIGPTFAAWTRSRLSPRRGPVLLTVPGIVGPECLEGSRPLGVTVTLSAHTAGMLRAAGHPDVRVVPPGIDLTRWPRLPRRERSRPTVFFAGHAGRHGGTRQAIDVAARVQRGGTPVRLVLALRIRPGQDEATELAVARAAAGAQGLDDVNVHGQLDSMPEALADADVVVFTPERFDGGKADLPLVVLEAMATGRPVVATRFPQLAALGDVVELTAAGDADAAAGAVRALLTDPARWAERASRGRDAVETRFAAPQMCRAYAEIYAELLSRPGVGAGGP
jgi:glycosyltransferase involved in cell wall biosynthesis